jgi:RNA polymerase sigma-70 factor (ECF subfamily)
MAYSSEIELLAACQNGERFAQKALYDKYKTQMYTLAYRITGNFEDADDVLQDGFVKVFKNLGQFGGKSNLKTWIHTIMARTALAKIRNKVHFLDVEGAIETETDLFEVPDDTAYLEKAILSLPDGYRSIFTLYEIEGFKHREIARMLGVSENTSKSQLHKAKQMLRSKLKGELK